MVPKLWQMLALQHRLALRSPKEDQVYVLLNYLIAISYINNLLKLQYMTR